MSSSERDADFAQHLGPAVEQGDACGHAAHCQRQDAFNKIRLFAV